MSDVATVTSTSTSSSAVVSDGVSIDVVVDLKTTLGEGPLWDWEQQLLYWIDSADGRIFAPRPTAPTLARGRSGRRLDRWP